MSERLFILARNELTKAAAVAMAKRFRDCGFMSVQHERHNHKLWAVEGIATLSQLQQFAMDELFREAK